MWTWSRGLRSVSCSLVSGEGPLGSPLGEPLSCPCGLGGLVFFVFVSLHPLLVGYLSPETEPSLWHQKPGLVKHEATRGLQGAAGWPSLQLWSLLMCPGLLVSPRIM